MTERSSAKRYANATQERRVSRSRRRFLQLLGLGAAGAVGGCATSGSGGGGETPLALPERLPPRKTITVSSGASKTIDVDANHPLENILIDLRASGASVNINAHGGGWHIRNVAVIGQRKIGADEDNMLNVGGVPKGEKAIIKNLWLGGGDDREESAIFVNLRHAGVLDIQNVYFKDWGTGIYASAPGNAPWKNEAPTGKGGVVRVENCYTENIPGTNYKLGTTGSYAKNCVAKNGGRCFWAHWQTTRWINCHASGELAWRMGYCWKDDKISSPEVQNTKAIIENCHTNCEQTFAGCVAGNYEGEPGANPVLEPPPGCPTTLEDALSSASAS